MGSPARATVALTTPSEGVVLRPILRSSSAGSNGRLSVRKPSPGGTIRFVTMDESGDAVLYTTVDQPLESRQARFAGIGSRPPRPTSGGRGASAGETAHSVSPAILEERERGPHFASNPGNVGQFSLRASSPVRRRRATTPLKHDRSSLRSRQSPGRPGSRRHQRWLNEVSIAQKLDEEEIKELWSVHIDSAFRQVFEGDHLEALSPFLNITEAKEAKLLGLNKPKRTKADGKHSTKIVDRFKCIDKRCRQMFQRGVGIGLVEDIEPKIAEFLSKSEAGQSFVLCLEHSMDRMIGHAVARFHGCSSKSHTDAKSGKRLTTFSKTKKTSTPAVSLFNVLCLLDSYDRFKTHPHSILAAEMP